MSHMTDLNVQESGKCPRYTLQVANSLTYFLIDVIDLTVFPASSCHISQGSQIQRERQRYMHKSIERDTLRNCSCEYGDW